MFTGSIVALITPMDEKGQICKKSLKKLIDYHVAAGTSSLVAVGTTGESATLSHDEHADVVMSTLELADGRIPVIAGIGTNATAEGVAMTQRFNQSGVVGYLSVAPYYNRPSQEGLYQHYRVIAESSDLPLMLYNVPGRTGCDILPETVARLAQVDHIIGIKEATGNLARVSQIQSLVDDDFILLSGDDATALDFMQLGGVGVISVTANIAAAEMVAICKLAKQGDFKQARKLNQHLMSLHHNLFFEPNPIPVKWAAKQLGLISCDTLRLPMTPLSTHAITVVAEALSKAGLQEARE